MGQFKQALPEISLSDLSISAPEPVKKRFKFLWRRIDDDIQTEAHITTLNKKIKTKLLPLLYVKLSQMEWDTSAFHRKLSVFSEYKKAPHQRKVLRHTKLLSFKSFHDSCLHLLKPFASTTKRLKTFHITLLGVGGRYQFSHLIALLATRLEELWIDLCYTSFTSKNKNPLDSNFCTEIGKCVNLTYLKIVSQTQLKDNMRALLFKKLKKIKPLETLELLPSASFLSFFRSSQPLFGAFNHIRRLKVEFTNQADFSFFLDNIIRLVFLESIHLMLMFLSFDGQLCHLGLLPNLKTIRLVLKDMMIDDQEAFQVLSILTAFQLESLKISFQDVGFKMGDVSYVAEILKFAPSLTSLSVRLKRLNEDGKSSMMSELARCIQDYAALKSLTIDLSSPKTHGAVEMMSQIHLHPQLKSLNLNLNLEFPSVLYKKENFLLYGLESLDLNLVSTTSKNMKKAIVLQNFKDIIEAIAGAKNLKKLKLGLKFPHEVKKEDKRLLSSVLPQFEGLKEFILNCYCNYFSGNEEEALALTKYLKKMKSLEIFALQGDNAEIDPNLWMELALCKRKVLV